MSNNLAQLCLDQAYEFISWTAPDGRLLFGNPAICRVLGYSQAEFPTLHISDISPWTRPSWLDRWQELKQRTSLFFNAELNTRTGEIIPFQFNIKYATAGENQFALFCGATSNQPVPDPPLPSGRLLQMQDEERRPLARQLHDKAGQNLGALSMNLSAILSSASNLTPEARAALHESIALADSSVREIRTISYLLHPPLLDELGLQSTLRTYAEEYFEKTAIRLDVDFPPMPRLPQAVETALFRIVQEGLSNIHRHSGSNRATLRVRTDSDRLELELIDYGRGMNGSSGMGIAGMRERARQLGGRLTIASGDTGTTLLVVLPLLQFEQLDASVRST